MARIIVLFLLLFCSCDVMIKEQGTWYISQYDNNGQVMKTYVFDGDKNEVYVANGFCNFRNKDTVIRLSGNIFVKFVANNQNQTK